MRICKWHKGQTAVAFCRLQLLSQSAGLGDALLHELLLRHISRAGAARTKCHFCSVLSM